MSGWFHAVADVEDVRGLHEIDESVVEHARLTLAFDSDHHRPELAVLPSRKMLVSSSRSLNSINTSGTIAVFIDNKTGITDVR